jgi:hypothetical protein
MVLNWPRGVSLFPVLLTTYTLQMNPIVSTVFGIANSIFEVWSLAWYPLVIRHSRCLPKQFLKEQKKYDGMVSDLAEEIGRICGFATLALDDIVCDETELLDRAVRKMCTLIADATDFICAYAKQHPGGTPCAIMLFPYLRSISSSHQISSDRHSYENQCASRRLRQAEGRL